MKNLILTFTFLLTGTVLIFAQQIQRDKVLVEIGTGTWCQYCPGAAMGADELVENGHDVAIIENHNGDSYTTTATNARNSYYGITGYPTAMFDGGSAYVGGSNTTSLYPQYLSRYNQKISVPTSFSLDIDGTTAGYFEFDVTVTTEMVDPYAGSDIRLHCVVTESNIEETWQGQDHLNFVNRLMVPSYAGTQLDFTSGNTVETTFNFELDPSWVPENCELVIFLQDNTNKTVLNASKRNLMEFENVNDYDAFLTNLTNIPEESCLGMFEPQFTLKNNGNMNLTSLDIHYQVNEGELFNYNWTGDIEFLGSKTITLPMINFTSMEENQILIYSENPNGEPDQYPKTDTIRQVIPEAGYTENTVSMYLKTDDHPEEITWELLNDQGEAIYSGGPYTQSGQLVLESFDLESDKCYRFSLYDAGGNGLNSPGLFRLYYGNNVPILQGTDDFESVLSTDFHSENTVNIDEISDADIRIFPNPANDKTKIIISSNNIGSLAIRMYNIVGELVYETVNGQINAGDNSFTISCEDLKSGVYLVNIMINDEVINRKVTISR